MNEKIICPARSAEEKNKFHKERANMNDWAKKVGEIDPVFAEMLDDNKIESFKKIREMGLPRYEMEVCSLTEFLNDPEKYLQKLDTKLFYIGLIPKTKELERFGKAWLKNNEVLKFVACKKIKEEDIKNYEVVLQQCFENKYRGNIQIGDEPWQVLVEFNNADKLGISKGGTPDFFVTRKKEGRFRYSFDSEELRKVIYNTVLSIPSQDDGVARKFQSGYYEFFIVKKDKNSPMEPIFFDYKDYKFDWGSKLDDLEKALVSNNNKQDEN